jgi:hypothetical protein
MRIECTTTFLHGSDRFEAGDIRTVPDELGAYFVTQGWAKGDGAVPAPGDVTLDIQNGNHTSEVTYG